MSESDIRTKVYEINAMDISQSEKAKLIFQLMNPPKTDEIINSKPKKIFCSHYKRHNYQVARCCNKVYPCRLCHDENEDHVMDRFDVEYMKCDFCHTFQKGKIILSKSRMLQIWC